MPSLVGLVSDSWAQPQSDSFLAQSTSRETNIHLCLATCGGGIVPGAGRGFICVIPPADGNGEAGAGAGARRSGGGGPRGGVAAAISSAAGGKPYLCTGYDCYVVRVRDCLRTDLQLPMSHLCELIGSF